MYQQRLKFLTSVSLFSDVVIKVGECCWRQTFAISFSHFKWRLITLCSLLKLLSVAHCYVVTLSRDNNKGSLISDNITVSYCQLLTVMLSLTREYFSLSQLKVWSYSWALTKMSTMDAALCVTPWHDPSWPWARDGQTHRQRLKQGARTDLTPPKKAIWIFGALTAEEFPVTYSL